MNKNFRFAHISDLHFGSIALNPFQFFSKRWLGNFNYVFSRKKSFAHHRLIELVDLFKKEGITHVIISGDLSITSRRSEFSIGRRFVSLLEKKGFKVFTVPGNHDHYTRNSYRSKRFYRYFEPQYDPNCPLNLKEDKVSYLELEKGLWLVGLDTAVATSLISSQGLFSPEAEKSLERALKSIPKEDQVILLNHFPFFEQEMQSKELVRGPALKELLTRFPNVFLYLHGHTHRQTVADLRPSGLPIISDSGSTPHRKGGACHLISLTDNAIDLDVYRYLDGWTQEETHSFGRS